MNDREIFGTFTERTRRVLGFAQQEALRLIITDEALKGGLVELPPSKTRPPIFSRKGSLIGLALGITLAFVIVFILVGRPPGSRTGIGRSSPASGNVSPGNHLRPFPIRVGFDFGFLLYLSLSKPVSQWRYRWLLLPLQLYAALNILLYRWTPDMLAKRHAKRLLEQSLQTRSS